MTGLGYDEFELEERINELRFLISTTFGKHSDNIIDSIRNESIEGGDELQDEYIPPDYPLAVAIGAKYGFEQAFEPEFRKIAHCIDPLAALIDQNLEIPTDQFDQYLFDETFYDLLYKGLVQGALYAFEYIQEISDIQYSDSLESEGLIPIITSGDIYEEIAALDVDSGNVQVNYVPTLRDILPSFFQFPMKRDDYLALPEVKVDDE